MSAADILTTRNDTGRLNLDQLQVARAAQAEHGSLAVVAAKLGFENEEHVLKAVGRMLSLPFVDLTTAKPDLSLLADFPLRIIHRHNIFPIRRDGRTGALVVAIGDPFDLHALDAVAAATGRRAGAGRA